MCSFSGTEGIKCNWQKKVPAGSDATRLDMNDTGVLENNTLRECILSNPKLI